MAADPGPGATRGRPRATSAADVARISLELFTRNGFEQTTMEEIAAAVGIARRTLFRYFASKNDIVWGDFDWVLARLRAELDGAPADQPIIEALADAVVASNHYDLEELPELRMRMTLITTVPALQAHSMVRYAEWRGVVATFVARRLGQGAADLIPLTVGYAALGTSMAAFVRWVGNPHDDLEENLRRGFQLLAGGFRVPVRSERRNLADGSDGGECAPRATSETSRPPHGSARRSTTTPPRNGRHPT